MARSSARLSVVPATPVFDPRQPEDMLGFLFTREATLRSELAEVEREIALQRGRYAAKHGLGMRPRLERLRALFGPLQQGEAR